MYNKILALICVAALLILAYIIVRQDKRRELLKKNISFFDSIRLTGFPIISFENNGKYIHMILDSGSNKSIINTSTLKDLEYKNLEHESEVFGLNGETQAGGYVKLPLSYKEQTYEIDCMSMDMTQTFGKMKSQFGITIHGILGTDFFEKYKYILDFDEMVAYSIEKL